MSGIIRIIEERKSRTEKIMGYLKKMGEKAKNMQKKTGAAIVYPIKQAGLLFSMCSKSAPREVDPEEIVESASLKEEAAKARSKKNTPAAHPGIGAACAGDNLPVLSGLNEISDAAAEEVAAKKDRKLSEKAILAAKKTEKALSGVIKFIYDTEKIIAQTISMRSCAYSPVLLLFYLRSKNYQLPGEILLAEAAFNVVNNKAEAEQDLNPKVIEYFIAEALEPTICINGWLASSNSLLTAYSSLYKTALQSVLAENKEFTKIEKTLRFYQEVLTCVRRIVSYALDDVPGTPDAVVAHPTVFTNLVERLLESEEVSNFLLHKNRVEEPAEETEQSSDESAEEVEQPTEQPAEEVEQPAEEPVEQPTEQPAEEVEQPTEQPAEEPVEEVEQPTEQPAEEPVEEVEQPTEQPIEEVEQPVEEVEQPTEQPAEEPTEEVEQPTEQLAEEQAFQAPGDNQEEDEHFSDEAVEQYPAPDPVAIMNNLMTSELFQKQREKNIKDGNLVVKDLSNSSPEMKKEQESSIDYIMRMGVPTPIARCFYTE
ncbi:uncharacterized protein NEMAJ01_0076 [Nematocida major]|uniref:uncharacterized protein n=1 Tax=Nematocida major TaxID=1912982 RepID=UPI002007555C|nr:uncharacterized protein NEMAJ01_0076 [Nematocida major]KAH9385180.1 hypothetical protein NEMAJ01_0076 [Nematocida major]